MQDRTPSTDPIHRFSSLGRPLDPAWATNRAVMVLMPVAAVLIAVVGPWTPGLEGTGRLWAALLGAGTVLGTWALGRELAPDDPRAAFAGMGLGVVVLLTVPGASLVLLFATLALARLVNRSVGLPPRLLDGVAIVGLIGWSMSTTQSVWVGVVAATAFGIDAVLPGGLRRHWVFAALSLVLAAVLGIMGDTSSTPSAPEAPALLAIAAAGLLFIYVLIRTRIIHSVGDVSGAPLSALRVRWGMAIVLVMAVQDPGPATLIWASIAGVAVSGVAPPGTKPDGA